VPPAMTPRNPLLDEIHQPSPDESCIQPLCKSSARFRSSIDEAVANFGLCVLHALKPEDVPFFGHG
jgi:hypothetical protein